MGELCDLSRGILEEFGSATKPRLRSFAFWAAEICDQCVVIPFFSIFISAYNVKNIVQEKKKKKDYEHSRQKTREYLYVSLLLLSPSPYENTYQK